MTPRIHVAFNAASRADVDVFFAAGLAIGGIENGVPGLRAQYHPNYYAAFVLDPDGYNIEAVCRCELIPLADKGYPLSFCEHGRAAGKSEQTKQTSRPKGATDD